MLLFIADTSPVATLLLPLELLHLFLQHPFVAGRALNSRSVFDVWQGHFDTFLISWQAPTPLRGSRAHICLPGPRFNSS